jgi:hypothetical protein
MGEHAQHLLLEGMLTPAVSLARSIAEAFDSCDFQSWNSSSPGPAAPCDGQSRSSIDVIIL